MKPNAILTAAAFVVALLTLAPAANAEDYYATSSGNWSEVEWRTDGCDGDVLENAPELTDGDTCTICPGFTVTVDISVNVAGITVRENAAMPMDVDVETDTLTVSGSVQTNARTLTVTGPSGLTINSGGGIAVNGAGTVELTGGGTATVNGTLLLSGSGACLWVRDDTTISGTGYVEGRRNDAVILIDSTRKLENEVTIYGALTVYASGATFQNDGTVLANYAASATQDTLKFDAGTITGTGSFEINTADAYLEFDATGVNATAIWGTLTISAGTVDCETQVVFLKPAGFTMTGGTILVDTAVDPRAMFEAH